MTLSQLNAGESRQIKQLGSSLNGQFRKRLLAMGIRPHAGITLIRKAPFGGAFHIETDGISLAIRKSLAQQIILTD